MSVLRGVLKEEKQRLKALLRLYGSEVKAFPRGSISLKRIRNGEYAYLAYRKKGQIHFDYLGLASSESVQKIAERRKLEALVKKAKTNLKEVERMLRVRAA
jgi:hypothetical protein